MEQEAQTGLYSSGDHLGLPKSLDPPQHQSKSPEPLYPSKSPDLRSGSDLACTRSRSECNNYHCGNENLPSQYGQHTRHSGPAVRQLTKGDSGYSSNLNIQQASAAGQAPQKWSAVSAQGSEAYPGGGFGLPPSFSSEDMRYMPISSFKPQGAPADRPPGLPTLLTGHSLFSSQLAQQYLEADGPAHPGPYHMGAANGLYGVSSSGMPGAVPSARHLHVSGPAGYHQNPMDPGLMGICKPYNQHGVGPWSAGGHPDIQGETSTESNCLKCDLH